MISSADDRSIAITVPSSPDVPPVGPFSHCTPHLAGFPELVSSTGAGFQRGRCSIASPMGRLACTEYRQNPPRCVERVWLPEFWGYPERGQASGQDLHGDSATHSSISCSCSLGSEATEVECAGTAARALSEAPTAQLRMHARTCQDAPVHPLGVGQSLA